MIPVTNDYGYALALRRAARTPVSLSAVADMDVPSWQYGEAMGRQAAEQASTVLDRDLKEAKIAEAARETDITRELGMAELERAREIMDVWAQQNKWASAIGAINLGITGLSVLGGLEEQRRREKMQEQLYNVYLQLPTALRDAARAAAEREDQWLKTYVRPRSG